MRWFFCLIFWSFLQPGQAPAQAYLNNGFFEGEAQDATVPAGWHVCAPGSTPDILPGPWGVFLEASEGETYIGLITREDGSFESIGQRLSQPLATGQCYELRVDLAHSLTYAGYKGHLQLRIWGGTSRCGKDQLLFESPLIKNSDWQTYSHKFTAEKPVQYLTLEAYNPDGKVYQMGNILIDHLSGIRLCSRA